MGDVTRRRRGLLAAAVLLLALAGSLGFVLDHDAVGSDARLADAGVGNAATLKGSFAPYQPIPAATDARWAPVNAITGNVTYVLLGADPGMVVLATSEYPRSDVADVIVHGTVALRMAHPDGSGRTLLVVQVHEWAHPILFG